jgi:hypothetical protein
MLEVHGMYTEFVKAAKIASLGEKRGKEGIGRGGRKRG